MTPSKQVLYLDRGQKTQTQIQKGSKLAKEPQGGERGESNHTRAIVSINAIDNAARVNTIKYYFCSRFFSFLVGGQLAGQGDRRIGNVRRDNPQLYQNWQCINGFASTWPSPIYRSALFAEYPISLLYISSLSRERQKSPSRWSLLELPFHWREVGP